MASNGVSTRKPWADGPMKLIVTPSFQTQKTDPWTVGATNMCLAHNAILRGFNSIYLQATHIPEAEKAAFVGYSEAWYRFVTNHHEIEEAELFPLMGEILNDKTVMDESIKEHEAFLDGLNSFHKYLSTLESPADYSGRRLRSVMDSFRAPFEKHFHAEIATLAALADHPNAPDRGSPEEAKVDADFKRWGRKSGNHVGITDGVPFFLLNIDRTAEGGQWANWPPIPSPVRWGMVNIAGWFHSDWWKFSSCDEAGNPRELYALQFPETKW